ncbi:MAG TPA: hypothetical protein VEI97_12410, partial [bacterium]|nr:hypothetical protein [bacterium]
APGPFRATIHPFKWFFTDDHPSPTVVGAPIPEHRMAYGATDTQRFELTIPPGGTLEWRVGLEAHYVEAADKLRPPDDPGGPATRSTSSPRDMSMRHSGWTSRWRGCRSGPRPGTSP